MTKSEPKPVWEKDSLGEEHLSDNYLEQLKQLYSKKLKDDQSDQDLKAKYEIIEELCFYRRHYGKWDEGDVYGTLQWLKMLIWEYIDDENWKCPVHPDWKSPGLMCQILEIGRRCEEWKRSCLKVSK